MLINKVELVKFAEDLARQQGAPVNTVIKELLHYEILFALNESGALEHLVFQGGTALRLCHRGQRYSEDLDFASQHVIPELPVDKFVDILRAQMAGRYGLDIALNVPQKDKVDGKSVVVDRWKATIQVPNPNKSIAQSQFINIEIASVPAYDPEFLPVVKNYPNLPTHLTQMMIPVESQEEIMADKIVALGARSYIKYRDIWDIKFLQDNQVGINHELIAKKLGDYGWETDAFKSALTSRLEQLSHEDCISGFTKEMSRFVDQRVATLFKRPEFIHGYLKASLKAGTSFLNNEKTTAVERDSSLKM
jgi:predicted nucleotidyltransferase component of viral defense system